MAITIEEVTQLIINLVREKEALENRNRVLEAELAALNEKISKLVHLNN